MLLIDTHNLFCGSTMKYGTVVDYDKLLNRLDDVYPRFAYVTVTGSSQPFANFLRARGFVVRTKEIRSAKNDTFDVDLTLDVLNNHYDRLIICSSSLNLLPLIKHVMDSGTLVKVHAFGIPSAIKSICSYEELNQEVFRGNAHSA
jgi:uncharacterized LabA/DUF88 family protein